MYVCEGQKWDLEHEVRKRDYEVLTKYFMTIVNTTIIDNVTNVRV